MAKRLILILKIVFILGSFTFIIWKSDTQKIWEYMKGTNPLYLLLAYLLMSLAQIISAYRMRFYYAGEGLQLEGKFCIQLYFTSMMFNTILPGGIGGDAYKIYTIGKLANFSRLRAFKITLSERASGLFILLIMAALFYVFTDFPPIIPYQNYAIIGLTALLIPAYFISINLLLKEKPGTAIGASIYSVGVQILNVAVAAVLLFDLGVEKNISEIMGYLLLFLISSVLSILPITIGGAGIREITFLYGGQILGLNPELGITLAFLFFIVNAACALNGVFFMHKGSNLKEI